MPSPASARISSTACSGSPEVAGCRWSEATFPTCGPFVMALDQVLDLAGSAHDHAEEELDVAARFLQFAQQQFHGFDGRHSGEGAAEDDYFVVFLGMIEQLFLARAGQLDVDGA